MESNTHLGIFKSVDGKSIGFGDHAYKLTTAADLNANWVTSFASSRVPANCHAWCPTPGKCWAAQADAAHGRVDDAACASAWVT